MLCAHVKPLCGSFWRSISSFFFFAFHNVKTIIVTAKITKSMTLTVGKSAPMRMLRSNVESGLTRVIADGVDLVTPATVVADGVDLVTLAVDIATSTSLLSSSVS